MPTPVAVPVRQVGSQQVQQAPRTIYLRQTDPNLSAPLPSAYGGLDNSYYAQNDMLFHNGVSFSRVASSTNGSIIIADPAQRAGARWSNQMATAIQKTTTFVNGLSVIDNDLNTVQQDLTNVQASIDQCVFERQDLESRYTNLQLYIGSQASQLTSINATLDSTETTLQNKQLDINALNTSISTLQNETTNASNSKNASVNTITAYNTVVTQTNTQLQSLGTSDTGDINQIINGDFTVWQRATSYAGANTQHYLTADRWYYSTTHGGSVNSTKALVTLPGGFTVNALTTSLTGNTGALAISTILELHAQSTVTMSIYLRADTDTTITFTLSQRPSSGSDTSYTSTDFNVTTSWQQFSATVPVAPQTNGQLTILQFSSTAWTGVQMARAQLQYGPDVLSFEERNPQLDLLLCKRYYESGYDYFNGYATSFSYISAFHQYNVEKRTTPTLTLTSSGTVTGFLDPVAIGAVNNTFIGSSMRQKNNRNDVGFFTTLWTADAELYV